ncbi:MAG: hypothetical protein R3F19_09575 [Verrucomicrobiales bacterium]
MAMHLTFRSKWTGKMVQNDLFIRNVSVKKLSGLAIGEPDADAATAAIAALKLLEPKATDVEQRESAQRLYQELAAVEQRFTFQRNYEAAAAVKEALDALKKSTDHR